MVDIIKPAFLNFLTLILLLASISCSLNDFNELDNLVAKEEFEKLKSLAKKKIANSGDVEYHKYLGYANSKLENYNECIKSYKIYLNQNEDDVTSQLILGDCYYKLGNSILAYETFQKAYELDSMTKNICYNLGIIEYEQDRCRKAINYFTRELKINKDDYKTLIARADCYETIGFYENAIVDAEIAMKIDQKNYDLIHTLASSQINIGHFQKAIETLKRGLKYFPNSDEFYLKIGSCYGALGMYQEAIDESNKALRLNSKNAKAFYLKALGYMNLNKVDSSCYNFKIAVYLDQDLSIPSKIKCT